MSKLLANRADWPGATDPDGTGQGQRRQTMTKDLGVWTVGSYVTGIDLVVDGGMRVW